MLYSILKSIILPPAGLFLVLLIGALLTKRRPALGRVILWVSLTLAYLFMTPFVAGELMAPLQPYPAVDVSEARPDIGAIVVLGAGVYFSAPEYQQTNDPAFGVDMADSLSLQRLSYAAYLAKETGKPLLLTGGSGWSSGHRSVAEAMATTLERDFDLEPRWVETHSTTTLENAQYSAELLHRNGIKKVYLVTHAWHMPRALLAFNSVGIEAIPAPTAFVSRADGLWSDFIPTAQAALLSYYAIHEWIGLAWYHLEIALQLDEA